MPALLAVLALFGAAYWQLTEARTIELKALMARLSGSEIIAHAEITSKPPLIALETVRSWTFKIDAEQFARLKTLCRRNAALFPPSSLDKHNGCVAAYYKDGVLAHYSTLTALPGKAEITVIAMSQAEFDDIGGEVVNDAPHP